MALHITGRESLREPLHKNVLPDFDSMTDEELLAYVGQDETKSKFEVPDYVVPDGMTYQWCRCEVFGRPDNGRIAEMEQRGWRAVPASRHDGMFVAPGSDGPIVVDGLQLMELPSRVVRAKRIHSARVAQEKVGDMNAQLSYAPPGTGPRGTHQFTQPVLKRERGVTEIMVE